MAPVRHGTFFLVLHPDGTLMQVDRRLRSTAHTARDVLEALGGPRKEPVVRREDGGCGRGGVSVVFRDPSDVTFEPLNPALWHAYGVAARGPAVVLGADDGLHAWAKRPRGGIMPQLV